jgi:hypothetical protein
MYGDLLVDLLLGIGGGGISESASGDTDEFSSAEVSVEVADMGRNELLFSSTSLSTCETIAGLGPTFRRWGLTMGELRMPAFALDFVAAFFLTGFLGRSKTDVTGAADLSSMSIGELFVFVWRGS